MPTLSFWHRRNSGPAESFDFAVVGGGILGVSTAFWLRRLRPGVRVAVVEAGALGSGASGRNAGFLLQGSASDFVSDSERYGVEVAAYLWQFSGENRAMIEWEMDGSRFDLSRTGSFTVAGSPDEADRLCASVEALRARGEPVEWLEADRLHARIAARGFFGGMFVPAGGTIDSLRLVWTIAAESGAELREHRPVMDLDGAGDRIRLETMAGDIEAGQAIFALNAYGPILFPWMAEYVRPVRAQMMATSPVGHWLSTPVYSHEGFYYLRQMPDGRLLVGGARHLFVEEEVGYEDVTTPGLQAALQTYIETHFPGASAAMPERAWSGAMGFSVDHLPLVGAMPDLPGSFWVGGLTGHGMGYGFRLGRLVAERVLGMPVAGEDRLFDANRPGARAAPASPVTPVRMVSFFADSRGYPPPPR
jgi:glycine/D-amino acid oxidase-like deaminating enzyme